VCKTYTRHNPKQSLSSGVDLRVPRASRANISEERKTMSGTNGHSEVSDSSAFSPHSPSNILAVNPFTTEKVRELVAALEVPFDPPQIEWRVMNTTKNAQPVRGQVVPYADQRAYTDRLNALFTPAGWTRKYAIQTSASFERSKDQKIVAKVLVTCEVTVFGLGSHSATGEEWADDENALTSAEAQSFKRACACFGLGRYLYYFTGTWVDLDEHKRPKTVPQLAGWATPAGWLQGLRPRCAGEQKSTERSNTGNGNNGKQKDNGSAGNGDVLREIERMEGVVGRRMYRGLLKSIAKVWNPKDIPDQAIREKVLRHLQAAERGLVRAKAARDKAGLTAYATVLGSLKLSSLEQVDSLKTLQHIVIAVEGAIKPEVR
jgi:hypothetical protein